MRAVVQRVVEASVTVDGDIVGRIGPGLLALIAVTHADTAQTADTIAGRLYGLRILPGETSPADTGAPLLVVSQFTLYGQLRRGRRPSWSAAAPAAQAEPLVEAVIAGLRARGAEVATGRFGAHMLVAGVNDGPVTVILEA